MNLEKILRMKKYNKLVNITQKKQTHRYREQTSGYQRPRGGTMQGLYYLDFFFKDWKKNFSDHQER